MRVNIIIVCSFWLLFFSCKEKQDIIDNSFSKKYKIKEPSLVINSNIKENESYMVGEFKYFSNNFSIKNQIYIKDSIYYYDKNKILFDFSIKKKSGTFNINDSLNLKTSFFNDIISDK